MGIDSLRALLSDLLYQHIKQELPSLRLELDWMYNNTVESIKKLGAPRTTIVEHRSLLIKLSAEFRHIAKAAVNGHDEDKFFASKRQQPPNSQLPTLKYAL